VKKAAIAASLSLITLAGQWRREGSAVAQQSTPPNVLLIQADDLGYGDLSAYGQARFETPSLDRLAREGIKFTQYYAGSTVCAPSRTALMTGLHTGHAWIRGNGGMPGGDVPLRPEDVTIAEVLNGAGYRTAVIGKWGLDRAAAASGAADSFHGQDVRGAGRPLRSGRRADQRHPATDDAARGGPLRVHRSQVERLAASPRRHAPAAGGAG
jgi:arylsulfatase A-like enzyme